MVIGGLATMALPLGQAERTGFSPEGIQFFESKIRPLLVNNCHECHGNEKHKGNLQLNSRKTILRGGDSGEAIVPGDPAKSLLIEAVKYTNSDLEMPPKKKLGKQAVADLEQWIRLGAPWPRGAETNPLLEVGHGLFAQLFLGRHLQVRVGVLDRLDQQALGRVAGHDCLARVAASQDGFAGVELEVAFVLFVAVALVAIVDEQRPNLAFKELDALRRKAGSFRLAKRQRHRGQAANHHKRG